MLRRLAAATAYARGHRAFGGMSRVLRNVNVSRLASSARGRPDRFVSTWHCGSALSGTGASCGASTWRLAGGGLMLLLNYCGGLAA